MRCHTWVHFRKPLSVGVVINISVTRIKSITYIRTCRLEKNNSGILKSIWYIDLTARPNYQFRQERTRHLISTFARIIIVIKTLYFSTYLPKFLGKYVFRLMFRTFIVFAT